MTLKAYYSSNQKRNSIQKVSKWLDQHHIPYQLIPYREMTREQLMDILKITENGFRDILSREADFSKIRKGLKKPLEQASVPEVIDFLLDNTRFLKGFILVKGSCIQTGFKEDEMRQFIPKDVRKIKRNLRKFE